MPTNNFSLEDPADLSVQKIKEKSISQNVKFYTNGTHLIAFQGKSLIELCTFAVEDTVDYHTVQQRNANFRFDSKLLLKTVSEIRKKLRFSNVGYKV